MRLLWLIPLLLLITTPLTLVAQASESPLNQIYSERSLGLTTYYMGWWGGADRPGSIDAEDIERFYYQEGLRFHYNLDIGWGNGANTDDSNIQFSQRVDNILTLADQYGTGVLIRTPVDGYGNPTRWQENVLNQFPSLATHDENGKINPFYLQVDNEDYRAQITRDINQLFDYYGHHPSFVGFIQSDIYSDAPRIDGGGCSACKGWYMLSKDSVERWLRSDFYEFDSDDNGVFVGSRIVTTPIKVWENIIDNHEEEWRSYVKYSNELAWDAALQDLSTRTGKTWLFAIHEVQIDRPWKISRGFNAFNGNPVDITRIRNDMNSVADRFLEGSHFTRSSLYYLGQPSFGSRFRTYTESEVRTQLGFLFPFSGGLPAQWVGSQSGSAGLTNVNSIAYRVMTEYGETLNRMLNVGQFYGINDPNAPRVLYVSTHGRIPHNPQFLTPSLNITVANIGITGSSSEVTENDPNLTKHGDFSQYDVIILARTGSGGSWRPSNSVEARFASFVRNGGGLVFADYSTGSFDFTSNGFRSIDTSHLIFEPFGSSIRNGGYTGTVEIKEFGSGRIVKVPSTYRNGLQGLGSGSDGTTSYGGSPRDSFLVILNNAIFYAAKQDEKIPTWWHTDPRTGSRAQDWAEGTFYSILGSPESSPLVWFYTESNSGDDVSLHLSASSFGLSDGWVALNVENLQATSGVTEDIHVEAHLDPRGWAPIYLLPKRNGLDLLYTNLRSTGEQVSGVSKTLSFSGPRQFSGWSVLGTASKPVSVSSSIDGILPEFPSLITLDRSNIGMTLGSSGWLRENESGWYWDHETQLLYIHFRSAENVNLEIRQPEDYIIPNQPIPIDVPEDLGEPDPPADESEGPAPPSPGQLLLKEAEDFESRSGFRVTSRFCSGGRPSGGQCIRLHPLTSEGVASSALSLQDGTYDVIVRYFNVEGARDRFSILLDNQLLDSWTSDGSRNAWRNLHILQVEIQDGDILRLECHRAINDGGSCQIDYVLIAPPGSSEIP